MANIIIIGGGAAGFFGAITAAQNNPNLDITLLEASRHPLHKVRISGGGRCNVTHACFDPKQLVQHYPRGNKALRGPFTRFQPRDTINWFAQQGVPLKTEADGRMFPTTDDSDTIAQCLLTTAQRAGVKIETQTPVQTIQRHHQSFRINLRNGQTRDCDRLLLATGSHPSGYRFAQTLGHSIIPPVPSLFTFTIRDPHLTQLAGISVPHVQLSLPQHKLKQNGPLLITHWGLSGPAVLKLSAWGARSLHDCHYRTPIHLNWLPQHNPETLKQIYQQQKADHPRKTLGNFSPIPLSRRLWTYHLQATDIDPQTRWAEISKKALNRLTQHLLQSQYLIQSKGIFKDEFVTCGGINLNEINFKTLESRLCPHLYLAGELLDIDGITGGFNFQNAWTTSWLAGQSLAQP
ncbi:NAD(P)/FAD-dependent oxidoreductase [Geitlerinema sp. P-1104]|uniref:NAD(P)/FAD-dependent oxidoreductase n=1 Tax=Geitlerinema sp. P-1104 TaxID=2546230 RepID=UPI001476D088|nr:NAD(P)/FAD-dependent oxidoreductase [Geitlerinema sp. P-1104]NMG59976.1 NAD(P)/FAD-dependent oxidoreductase [Geitlerinema sp. P-1104]